jgi:hypothetical protein
MATSAWISFPCANPEARWRYLDDGRIEVDGLGIPTHAWPLAVNQWSSLILPIAAKYGLPAHYIAGPMSFESGGNPKATSYDKAGNPVARGLMQFTWDTAKTIAAGFGRALTNPSELYDPALSIELGAAYLSDLLKRYKGDFVSAMTGYNAGRVICGGCRSGTFWGVCTDGSQYPLLAIKYSNAALAYFPLSGPLPPVVQPPILVPPAPSSWSAIVAVALGGYAAYRLTAGHLRPVRRRRAFAA